MMSTRFSVRRSARTRPGLGNCEYEIFDGVHLVARYWHDFRGDEHGITFIHGDEDPWPVGRSIDFLTGGGPEPLRLTDAAVAYLTEKLGSNR